MRDVVLELEALIDKNDWTDMFTEAVANAHKQNIARLHDVRTLDDYFGWINGLLEWVPAETRAGDEIYNRLCEFYFFLDQEPVKALQNKIEPHDQSPGLPVLDSPIGLVAVLPIGMAQVSSVVTAAEVGSTLHKGEGFGYFQFGGSDHIVLFEAAAAVELSAQPDVHYKQGVRIGRSRKSEHLRNA